MGFSSGTDIAVAMIEVVRDNVVGDKVRAKIYEVLINALEEMDWDTQNEAMGIDPAFDKVMKKLNPDWED